MMKVLISMLITTGDEVNNILCDCLDYDVELVQTKSSGRRNPRPKVFEGGS